MPLHLMSYVDVSSAKVLQETCNYIQNLHREVDDLSDRLSQLLANTESNSAQAAIIRSLLMIKYFSNLEAANAWGFTLSNFLRGRWIHLEESRLMLTLPITLDITP
ncbi:hypothetical protein Lal_00018409 [Lupinus albus]|nr:hypothetical protein Lal_00018409 [Lupinus albus]